MFNHSSTTPHLRFDLQYQRGNFCLDMQADWSAPCTVILGPSGAGKSSLLMLLAGLYRPDQGQIEVAGCCLTDAKRGVFLPPEQRQIGLMWQDGQLFPHLTVEQNLRYGYRLLAPDQRRIEPALVIELLEIGHLLTRQPRHLSGGEKQRVALGRTLLAAPRCLLLDEPLNALNHSLRVQILDFLKHVPERFGIPVVLVTHQPIDAVQLDAEVWHCEAGRLWRDVVMDVEREKIQQIAQAIPTI
jgi:molybdate transport system ATP-binding protein